MKNLFYILLALFVASFTSALAAKPDGVGKGKSGKEMSEAHKQMSTDKAAKAKSKVEAQTEAQTEAETEKKSGASDKSDAIRKEAGKGSETGQAKREENSRKWWRFWGD